LVPAKPGNDAARPPDAANPGAASDRGAPAPNLRPARKLPPGFKAREQAGYHESGWPLVIVGERDGGTMVLVPGGTFTMGSDRGDPWNGPSHSVRLSTYYIDQYEVTNRQFRTFLQETEYVGHPPGKWLTSEKVRSMPDNAPVVFVSHHDAEEYAMWALKRLPTEAQWEMAARSADGRRYPWGDQAIRWSRPRKFHQIEPVASFTEDVSPFGVFDMAGNAVEWVRDWYDPRYYDKMRDKTTEDPTGPPDKRKGIQRVVKGSSRDWLVFDRQGMNADQRVDYVGFRCSLAVEGGEASAIIAPRPPKPETPKPGATPPGGQAPGGNVPF
jgi:formylglycine-generating enzyme required for sulfatase activity